MADAPITAAVKRKLNITWSDTDTDARVDDVITAVNGSLPRVLGIGSSYVFQPSDPQEWGLFLNACLYEWSNAYDEFPVNYADDIAQCMQKHRVVDDGA